MADQRAYGSIDRSPAEVGTQVRDKAQEVVAQVRDKAQEMVRQGAETASDYYQQGRQQMEAAEHTLEEGIRAKPLQSIWHCQVVKTDAITGQQKTHFGLDAHRPDA